MAEQNRSHATWVDNSGAGFAGSVIVGTAADAQAIWSAVAAVNNITWLSYTFEQEFFLRQSPVSPTATYIDVGDVAILEYQTGTAAPNGKTRLVIPAPKSTIFLPDGVTVAGAQVTAISNAMISGALDVAGRPVVGLTRGYRGSMPPRRY